jgi:succinate dehydrogenase / fumarate reductase cytochrome b subunit
VAETNQSFLDRHYFFIRRLHSLTGVVPIGAFLFPHLTTNSSILWGSWLVPPNHGHAGVETFQHEVNFIHSLPFLVLIEIFILWLPIAFHAGVGIWFALSGKLNVNRYKYQDNWRYTLQRISGYVGVLYIFLHISSLRWGWTYGGLLPAFDGNAASSTTAAHFQESSAGILVPIFYLICVLALVYHFANGLWTAAITWGLTISERAQQRWGRVCVAVGIVLGIAALLSVIGFSILDVDQAREVEAQIAQAGGH